MAHASLVRGLGGGLDTESGRQYLVMEYVDGLNALTRLNRGGPLRIAATVRLAADVGAALRHLHGRSLIHRDVKPDNILLAPDGSAKLADLGLARRVRVGGETVEASPAAAGTPHYMPPEQTLDPDRADPRSDLYALGATLYHLLTGVVPFDGESQDELLRQKLSGSYRLATEVRPELSGAVDQLLGRLLAPDPAERYQTAGEFLAGLRELFGPPTQLTDEPTAESPPESPQVVADGDQARTHIDLPALPPRTTVTPATGLALLVGVLMAGLAARWAVPIDSPLMQTDARQFETNRSRPALSPHSPDRPVEPQ